MRPKWPLPRAGCTTGTAWSAPSFTAAPNYCSNFGEATSPLRSKVPEDTAGGKYMAKLAMLYVGLMVGGCGLAAAQDIAGIEDCTKTSGLDKRTGCLQSNVNFLQQLATKNPLDARQRRRAGGAEIAARKTEIAARKAALASQQASVEQLKAALKAAAEKKPEGKK